MIVFIESPSEAIHEKQYLNAWMKLTFNLAILYF